MKFWWISNFFWFILFAVTAIFIGIRDVDGAGVEQTPELRLLAFIVLGIAFLFVLVCQLVFLYLVRKTRKVH
jgi:hypothetical protein